MKELTPYRPFDRFIFRTPLFPFDLLNKEEELMNNKAFAEAALIASPELSEEIEKFQKKAPKSSHKEKERIIQSVVS